MKGIIVTNVSINHNNITMYSVLGQPTTVPGMKEIEFDAIVDDMETQDKLEDYMNGGLGAIKSIPSQFGELIDCHINQMDTNLGVNGNFQCQIHGQAKDIIEEVEVQFKDCFIKVKSSKYQYVKNNYGNPEDMTFNEFNDCVMVEEL